MSSGQIFISYRREDSAGYTRAIYDRLVRHFTKERVFMDVDAIEPGLPFDEAIHRALDQCRVQLVMIGKHWLDKREGLGPRINDPKDFVRLEIAAALSQSIRVIPVLLDGARMPGAEELPEALGALARRNALEISNSRFDADTENLVRSVRRTLGESENDARIGSGLPAENMRPDINGRWEAAVTYDWPNAGYIEKFDFRGTEEEVYGTASFLGGKKQILEGSIKKNALRFITRSREILGGDSQNAKDVIHRYRGEVLDDEIRFFMQTEGGYSEHIPIEFKAKKETGP